MIDFKGTKGEWKADEARNKRTLIKNEKGYEFIDIWKFAPTTQTEHEANVRLVLGARDVLAKLQEITILFDCGKLTANDIESAKQIIEKSL